MSLYKQLWIAVALLMLMVFGVTFVINGVSSSQYLEQQLSLKNQDDANSLALSLSQQDLDPVVLEIQLAAHLDQGSYEYIQFRSANGQIIFDRSNPKIEGEAPALITTLFPIYSLPGVAEVTNGWNQIGSISLKSDDQFAYDELWNGAKRTLIALILGVFIAGVVGSLLLRVILNPLNQVVGQAQAIGQRRFITLTEPFTTEFAEVTRSMNELSRRVKEMLSRESQRLERQREVSDLDPTTGVLQRSPFMALLRAKLESEDADASGTVALVRISELARMNQTFGRQPMDTVLKAIGTALKRLCMAEGDWAAGRLNGSDFCLLAPKENNAKRIGEIVQRTVAEALRDHSMEQETTLPASCVEYVSGDSVSQVMTSIDGALLAADEEGESSVVIASHGSSAVLPVREQGQLWKAQLTSALANKRLMMEAYPVIDSHQQLIHQECMVRIRVEDRVCNAGEFMPWVHRLDLGAEVDRAVVELAMEAIGRTNQPTCANLTAASLTDTTFAPWLEEFLIKHSAQASLLSIEVGEAPVYTHTDGFRRLSQRAHALDVKLGIEHMGYRISDVGKLGELGVDYIKIDGLFVRDIDKNAGNAALFRTYANIAQTLGLPCIAEGVSNEQELATVFDLGATGASGRGVKLVTSSR